jgi:hypothetical protein
LTQSIDHARADVRWLAVAVAVATTWTVLVLPAGAKATPLPPAVDMNISNGVVPSYLDEIAASPEVPNAPCDADCLRLRDQSRALMPNGPGGAAVRRETRGILEKIGGLPKLKTIGQIGLAVETFRLGWKIGTGIRTRWLGVDVPGIDPVSPVPGGHAHYQNLTLRPCDYHGSLWTVNGVSGVGYSTCGIGYTIYGRGYPQFALAFERWESTVYKGTKAAYCPENPLYWPPLPLFGVEGGSFYYDATGGTAPGGGTGCATGAAGAPGWTMSLVYTLDSTAVEDYGSQPYDRSSPSWPGMPTTLDELKARLRAELEAYPDWYRHLIAWLDAQLGGGSTDPSGQIAPPVTVPSCAGVSYTTCVTRLHDRGFTDIERDTVSRTEADLDKAPDEVLSLTPDAGDTAPTSATITVRTNPPAGDMPVLVPSIRMDETYASYAARLVELDLVPQRETLEEPQWDYVANAVIYVSPAVRKRVRPDTEIRVVTNPPDLDERNTDCEPTNAENADPDPGRDVFEVREQFTRREGANPEIDTPLYWGTTSYFEGNWGGWGYRHIAAKHGWDEFDRAATATALQSEPKREGVKLVYDGPEYQRNGALCARRVIVEPVITRAGQSTPREIVTSYGRLIEGP